MSEYQPDGNIVEGKVFSKFDGDLRCVKLGKAIKADLEEGHVYSIIEESDSYRKKHCPPSFTPPPSPPPRPAKTQQRKPKTKQSEVSEQDSPEKSGSMKRSNEGNIDETKVNLTEEKPIVPNEANHITAKPAKGKKKDTTTFKKNKNLKNILSSPKINDKFERKCQIQDAVEKEEKTEANAKNKEFDYVGFNKDDTEQTGQIYYLPMSPINKAVTNNVDTLTCSGRKKVDIKCNDNLELDSDKAEKETDDNEYEIMGNAGTDTIDVISPTWKRKGKTILFRSLSKRELVKYLGKCGLQNLAAVCEKEKLDGHFLEKYVNDEDLMQEPFFLTHFQIKKLRAILNGWRPISEFPIDIDGISD